MAACFGLFRSRPGVGVTKDRFFSGAVVALTAGVSVTAIAAGSFAAEVPLPPLPPPRFFGVMQGRSPFAGAAPAAVDDVCLGVRGAAEVQL